MNRFRIVEPLARGGQGEIFVAEDKSEGELCILKVYDRSITEKEQARIIRLADLVGKLKHPGILCARECVFGASFSVVYPFIKGGALSVKAPSEGKFQEMKQVECYAIQMCHILDFLHGENIVHRDIKPDNFLFDEKGRVFLTDFDFAIFPRWDNYVTLFNKRVRCQGTSLYMAPEHLKAGLPHIKMDIYAYATSLYFLICGQFPFGRNLEQRFDLNNYRPISRLSKKQNDALKQALHPKKKLRTESCKELYRSLF